MDSVPTSSGVSNEAVQLQAGVGTRREPRPTFTTLEENLSKIEELDDLLAFDLTKFKENATEPNGLASSAKKLIRSYKKISRDMSTFCIKQGSVDEAQKVRDKRTEYVKHVQEVLLAINTILCENCADLTSNLEESSVRSGYSLTSQLNFHSPLQSPKKATSPVFQHASHNPCVDHKLPEQGAASPRTCNASSATLPTSGQHAHQPSSGVAFQSSTPRTTDSLGRVNYLPLSLAGPPTSSSIPGQQYDKSDSSVPFFKPPYSSFNQCSDYNDFYRQVGLGFQSTHPRLFLRRVHLILILMYRVSFLLHPISSQTNQMKCSTVVLILLISTLMFIIHCLVIFCQRIGQLSIHMLIMMV